MIHHLQCGLNKLRRWGIIEPTLIRFLLFIGSASSRLIKIKMPIGYRLCQGLLHVYTCAKYDERPPLCTYRLTWASKIGCRSITNKVDNITCSAGPALNQ